MRRRGAFPFLALVAALVVLPQQASASASWRTFQVIIWQPKTPRQYQALQQMGFTAAAVRADRTAESRQTVRPKVRPIIEAKLRPYVENIATDFFSAYHRWQSNQPVNAAFLAKQRAIAANPQDTTAFIRSPGLSDPVALSNVQKRIRKIVRLYSQYRPLFYDLGDEMGIADLSAAWDFDFSQWSLVSMRRWLKRQYGTLEALNRQWDTAFKRWQDVIPPTTTEAMRRRDENFSAWADFKSWMDIAFARSIKAGTNAVHSASRQALSGMEGAQMPGWGGYDYSLISTSVDVMEMYDAGESLRLAQAFNPRLKTLTTVDWSSPGAPHAAWRQFLRGVRGMIVWDPNDGLVKPDGTLEPYGVSAGRFIRKVNEGPASLIARSRPVHDPVAVLYSPQSYRVQWLLDHRAMGASWTTLSSEDQNADNAVRAAQRRIVSHLDQLGIRPTFITDRQVATFLQQQRNKVLALPNTLTVSKETANAIREFVRAGGVIVSSGEIGTFDEHGRRLAEPRFTELARGAKGRVIALEANDETALRQMDEGLKLANLRPKVQIVQNVVSDSNVEHYVYRNGRLTILALLRGETNQLTGVTEAVLSLSRADYVYDLVANCLIAHRSRLRITVNADEPALLAISSTPRSYRTCN